MYLSKNDMKFNFIKKNIFIFIFILIYSCADYKNNRPVDKIEKLYHTSSGFALIFEDDFYDQKIVNKKIKNDDISVMHSYLKRNTLIEITNPETSITIEAKVTKRAQYPSIYSVVISQKVAELLELNSNDPFIELREIKKNKTFIAKDSNTFEEEKKVAEKAPVENIEMNDLTTNSEQEQIKSKNEFIFTIIISDFYYLESANKLKEKLSKERSISGLTIEKIKDNKYRLAAGPFKNFNALKSTYISLNKLGFENLNINKNK